MTRKREKLTENYLIKNLQKLTPRDKEIILTTYQLRFLRLDQLQRLFFISKRSAQKRLKILYEKRFLDRSRFYKSFGKGSYQYVYFLDEAGARFVAAKKGVRKKELQWNRRHRLVEVMFLEHTLAINEIYVRLKELERKNKACKLTRWISEREFQGYFWKGMDKLRPDAYFQLALFDEVSHAFAEYDFFLEVDLGTMRLKRFAEKIMKYVDFFLSGSYRNWFLFYPVTLIISPTASRLNSLKETTKKVLKENKCVEIQFLFTTQKRLEERMLLGRIWEKAYGKEFFSLRV